MTLLEKNNSIYVAGSNGMVGNAICKLLNKNGYTKDNKNLLTSSRKDLDLKDSKKVDLWFKNNKPNIVIIAAAKVGGIMANKLKPVEFLLENLRIQNNLIESSWKYEVKRLLFLGSSCIYPKFAKQPIKESYLLSDKLENSNQSYAIAKIAGLKLCEAYRNQYGFDAISLMPTNLYGPKDNYNSVESHVMASLIRKFYEAKKEKKNEVVCWGSGLPLREFLYLDDFAEACLHVLKYWSPNLNNSPIDDDGGIINWLNVGSDYEISIKELAEKIAEKIGFKGNIIWDNTKPDGTPGKKLDTFFIKEIDWTAKTDIDSGIKKTIESFKTELQENQIRT